jgi:hypothetical protein
VTDQAPIDSAGRNAKPGRSLRIPSTMPTEPTETILATPSTSESVLSEMPPRITITLNELARALDQMGSTEPVLATRLYHTLLQLQSLPPTAGAPTTIQSKPNHDVYANKQYTMSSSSAAMDSPEDRGSPIQSSETQPSTEILSDKEIRRRMLEMAKASFPDGIPSPYVIIDVGSPPRLQSARPMAATLGMKTDNRGLV